MQKPKVPANESERLKSLKEYQVLDTLPEDLYDDITEIASKICDTPISLISLIDENRQWFKSHHGLAVSETPRDLAYCAHAINEPDKILEVPDAFDDERFHDNPLATGDPHVRFYAGAPLTNRQGHTLGTLCVIDHEKKKLTERQKKSLWALSRQVVALLELRSENIKREERDSDFNDLVENLGDGVFELDGEGKCLYANNKMLDMLQRNLDEVLNTSIWEMIYHEDVTAMQAFYGEQFKKKSPKCFYEYRLSPKKGKPVWVSQNTTMQYEGDRMIKLRTIARDMSETKLLEEELELKETLYKLVSENSTDLIALHEPDATYKFVSPSAKDLLGYKPSELVGTNAYSLIHPEDIERLQSGPHESTLKGVGINKVEYRLRKKDGSYLWMESYAKPIFDGKGNVTSFQTSSRDISDKKIEQERSEKYKEGLTLLNELATSTLTEQKLLDHAVKEIAKYLQLDNGAISEILNDDYYVRNSYRSGRTKEFDSNKTYQLSGTLCDFTMKCQTALLIDKHTDFDYKGHSCLPGETIESYIGSTIFRNGRKYGTVSFFSKSRRTKSFAHFEGEFIQLFANWIGSVLEAISEKQMLQEARSNAEVASQEKASFLSMMSHEIRTPLNGIIGITHLLLNKSPTQEQLSHLDILKQSGDNLLAIVNDILDFNKIEEGKIELDVSIFDLRRLIETIYKNYAHQGADKGVNVLLTVDSKMAQNYSGDSVRISQVLHNLMSNAIKFTDVGDVALEVSVSNQHGEYDELYFMVSDTGIGIPRAKQDQIFDVFTQEDKSITRKFGGSGLGLAIIKRLLELMESEIQLESEPGKGSKFSFKLVMERHQTKRSQQAPRDQLLAHPALLAKILLVEDNDINRVIARDFLESWGCDVLEAQNGKEALGLLEKTEVDLVLLDLQMPVMDGYETIKAIRTKNEKRYKDLPVLALTAAALGDAREKVFQSGMNDFITKPFLPFEFYSKISSHLGKKEAQSNNENIISHIQTKLTETLGNDGNIDRYLGVFTKTIEEEIEYLIEAINTADLVRLNAYSHKNKSSFKLVGLDQAASIAEELENMIARNSPKKMILEKAKDHYKEVEALLKKLRNTK